MNIWGTCFGVFFWTTCTFIVVFFTRSISENIQTWFKIFVIVMCKQWNYESVRCLNVFNCGRNVKIWVTPSVRETSIHFAPAAARVYCSILSKPKIWIHSVLSKVQIVFWVDLLIKLMYSTVIRKQRQKCIINLQQVLQQSLNASHTTDAIVTPLMV